MASCTQIEQVLQAFIDDDLSDSERVIFEGHVAECKVCEKSLRIQQATSAELFEGFAAVRLRDDLTQSVLEHLPDTEFFPKDVAAINRRAKHPGGVKERLYRLVPVAAAALLVVLGAVIRDNWPGPAMPYDAIGVVTFAEGTSTRFDDESENDVRVKVEEYVRKGTPYRTSENGRLMLMLAGSTSVKLNRATSLVVHDERKITMNGGQAYFDVGKSNDRFHVYTPNGDVTVWGTSFDIQVTAMTTRIVLAEGQVDVRHKDFQDAWVMLQPGEMVKIVRDLNTMRARPADVTGLTIWARDMVSEETAGELFAAKILPQYGFKEIVVDDPYTFGVQDRHIESITISWVPSPDLWDYCSYDIRVYGDENTPIFSGRIDSAVFSASRDHSTVLLNPTGFTPDVSIATIELSPDCGHGSVKPDFEIMVVLVSKGKR